MKKVLVVDDSKTVRVYHKQVLENMGYLVSEAENGMEAVEKTVETLYDMYVVDVNMPVMDGYTFLKELRDKYSKKVPVIMISTEAEEIDKIKAYESGANLYFIKPAKPQELDVAMKVLMVK
jgi:two-component system chemotaxis response regulator CheY